MDAQAAHSSTQAGISYSRYENEAVFTTRWERRYFRDLSHHWHIDALGNGQTLPPREEIVPMKPTEKGNNKRSYADGPGLGGINHNLLPLQGQSQSDPLQYEWPESEDEWYGWDF
jgi:hypothetical protein